MNHLDTAASTRTPTWAADTLIFTTDVKHACTRIIMRCECHNFRQTRASAVCRAIRVAADVSHRFGVTLDGRLSCLS